MALLADTTLLAVWECARLAPLPRRVQALLNAAREPDDGEDAGRLTLGEAHRRLLALHAQVFGPRLVGLADCAECGEPLEFDLDVREFIAAVAASPAAPEALVVAEGVRLAMRAPTLDDCIAAAEAADGREGYKILLARCVEAQAVDGTMLAPQTLTDALMREVDARLAAVDPAVELSMACTCPACGVQADTPLDVGAFVWAEVEARAPRLIAEVHRLAARYGWREADILEMGGMRRAAYLAMADA